jgi:hypothetical protein
VKKILLLCAFFAFSYLQANSQVVTGNVIDGLDRDFLENVLVVNLQSGDSSMTNERGYFRVPAKSGDSLIFLRYFFIPKAHVVGSERHILVDIFLDGRTLPTFDLYADRVIIPFRAGNQSTMRALSDRPAGPGKVYAGTSNNQGLQPGLTLDGPISYFMKSERQKRAYAKKLAFLARQKDYLELIQSDSVMQALKYEYRLSDKDLDELIIEFNLLNIDHQFVDMDWEQVERLLTDFLERKTAYRKEE